MDRLSYHGMSFLQVYADILSTCTWFCFRFLVLRSVNANLYWARSPPNRLVVSCNFLENWEKSVGISREKWCGLGGRCLGTFLTVSRHWERTRNLPQALVQVRGHYGRGRGEVDLIGWGADRPD